METLETYHGVSLRGLPVRLELQWPFHRSEGGSDWHVVHGRLWLADGGELHADVALNLSESINEVLPSRDGDLAFQVAVNTARKALDDRQRVVALAVAPVDRVLERVFERGENGDDEQRGEDDGRIGLLAGECLKQFL